MRVLFDRGHLIRKRVSIFLSMTLFPLEGIPQAMAGIIILRRQK
jgi:hypothetical protein